jgi:large subunit ribosomal protein L4
MKYNICDLNQNVVGDIELDDVVFGLEARSDILARIVHWQLAKRRQGTHETKEIGDVRGSTKKIYKQKGTGGARHGSKRGPQFRGGAIIFGPHSRDHSYDLPKKVRRLGLKMALSDKMRDQKLLIVDKLALASRKTSDAVKTFAAYQDQKILLVDQLGFDDNLKRAVSNLHKIDILPQIGINVYDIIRKDLLVLSVDAVKSLQERLRS